MTRGRALALAAVALAALVARAPLHLVTWAQPVSNDDAIPLLMARHVLAGELSTILWNQPYNGTLDTYLLAPALAVAPAHGAFRAYEALCAALFVALVGRLAFRLAGGRAGFLAAGLAAVGTPYLALMAATGPTPNFLMPLVTGAVLLVAWRPSAAVGAAALAGVVAGLAVWNSALAIPALAGMGAGLLLAGRRPVAAHGRRLRGRARPGCGAPRDRAGGGRVRRQPRDVRAPALALAGRRSRPRARGGGALRPAGAARGRRPASAPPCRSGSRSCSASRSWPRSRWAPRAGRPGRSCSGAPPCARRSRPAGGRAPTRCGTCTASRCRRSHSRAAVSRASCERSRAGAIALARGDRRALAGRAPARPDRVGRSDARRPRVGGAAARARARDAAARERLLDLREPAVRGPPRPRVGGARSPRARPGTSASRATRSASATRSTSTRRPPGRSPRACRAGCRARAASASCSGRSAGRWREDAPADFVVFRRFVPPFDEARPVPRGAFTAVTLEGAALPAALDRDPATVWTSSAGIGRGTGLELRLYWPHRLSALALTVDLGASPLATPWVCEVDGVVVARGPARHGLQWVNGAPRAGKQALLAVPLGDRWAASSVRLIFQDAGPVLRVGEVFLYGPDEPALPRAGDEAASRGLAAARAGDWSAAARSYAEAVRLEPDPRVAPRLPRARRLAVARPASPRRREPGRRRARARQRALTRGQAAVE